jgi:hypothetical protein
MSAQEFRAKFQMVKMIGDGLCLFHCIAYGRRQDKRSSHAKAERDEFLRRYRERFKGRRDAYKILGMASDEEWDDMERRVQNPSGEHGFPNHFAIYMAQEIFNIIIYVWSKRSQRQYAVSLAPSPQTTVTDPRFTLHLLHDQELLHYDVLLPRWDYVQPSKSENIDIKDLIPEDSSMCVVNID